ncbi:MAG: hypothetical protein ACLQGP_22000 [Isosphaeraceae bacterium]
MQVWEANAGASLVDALRIGKHPGSRSVVSRVIEPWGADALRAALVHRDAVLEISRVPCRDTALGGALSHPIQRLSLKDRLSDRVLGLVSSVSENPAPIDLLEIFYAYRLMTTVICSSKRHCGQKANG